MNAQLRRRPIRLGDRVWHMDAREGLVVELIDAELPMAVVDFDGGGRECVALGYLQRVGVGT
jgi:hypothetical protein